MISRLTHLIIAQITQLHQKESQKLYLNHLLKKQPSLMLTIYDPHRLLQPKKIARHVIQKSLILRRHLIQKTGNLQLKSQVQKSLITMKYSVKEERNLLLNLPVQLHLKILFLDRQKKLQNQDNQEMEIKLFQLNIKESLIEGIKFNQQEDLEHNGVNILPQVFSQINNQRKIPLHNQLPNRAQLSKQEL